MSNSELSVLDFGAVASDTELQTKGIQQAIDACFRRGGGRVIVPKGRYLIGGLRLRSRVTLYLQSGAVLIGSRNPEDYNILRNDVLEPLPQEDFTDTLWCDASHDIKERDFIYVLGSRWNNAMIRAAHAEDIAIIGEEGAVIDGADCYDAVGEEHYRGPHAIAFHDCRNVILRGYTVRRSANWAHNTVKCVNLLCEDVTVEAGHDGFHATCCRNLDIRNSRFYTGDDCVAGIGNVNVTVADCELNSACSAMRFGGTNALIKRCRMYGPGRYLFRGSLTLEEKISGVESAGEVDGHRRNMLSAFTYYADFSFPIEERQGNIIIEDCVIEHADRFLHFNYSGNEPWQCGRPLENITFQNIRASHLKRPITAYGDAEHPVELTLSGLTVTDSPDFEDNALIWACNYRQINVENLSLSGIGYDALAKVWSEGELRFRDIHSDIPPERYIVRAQEKFFANAI